MTCIKGVGGTIIAMYHFRFWNMLKNSSPFYNMVQDASHAGKDKKKHVSCATNIKKNN